MEYGIIYVLHAVTYQKGAPQGAVATKCGILHAVTAHTKTAGGKVHNNLGRQTGERRTPWYTTRGVVHQNIVTRELVREPGTTGEPILCFQNTVYRIIGYRENLQNNPKPTTPNPSISLCIYDTGWKR